MKLEKIVYIDYIGGIENISSIEDVLMNVNVGNMLLEDYKNLKKMENKKVKLTLEIEEPILDDVERKYLSGVIRPFRNKIKNIRKKLYDDENEFIIITFKDNDSMTFKNFEKGLMYKNMELNKEYTLEDLEL